MIDSLANTGHLAPPWTLFRQVDNLPVSVFYRDEPTHTIFYTAGAIALIDARDARTFTDSISADSAPSSDGRIMWELACQAEQTSHDRSVRPYTPECLTIYLHHSCNLACTYCYAKAAPLPTPRISEEAVEHAARLVAQNCQQKNLPLTVVFHGGGEPTLDQQQVMDLLGIVRSVAAEFAIQPFLYVATNGVLSQAKARWVAQEFDLVGLSCDGPPWIQDRQRPRAGGQATSEAVERTARILHEIETPFDVRVTITAETLPHMGEIATYICEMLHPQVISMEPVYGSAGGHAIRTLAQAEVFVAGFEAAQAIAGEYGIPLHQSLSRYFDNHGPHCDVDRNVLRLTPSADVSVCFKTNQSDGSISLGTLVDERGTQSLDYEQAHELRQALQNMPAPCRTCFNRFHCVRGCPDFCALTNQETDWQPGPRCYIAGHLTFNWIQQTMRNWREEHTGGQILIRSVPTQKVHLQEADGERSVS